VLTNLAATLSLTQQHFAALDLELPDAFTAELAEIDQQLSGREQLLDVDRSALAATVADCLAAGRDPATDDDVNALLTRVHLSDLGIGRQLADLAHQRRAEALTRHTDDLVAALQEVVRHAHQALAHARTMLPPRVPITDPYLSSTLRGPEQLAAYGEATVALDRLTTSVQTWVLLGRATGQADVTTNHPYAPLILAALTADQLAAVPRKALAPAHAGHDLELASFAEFHERVANIDLENQRRMTQRQHDDRRRSAAMATNRA
jgi:uncharacterized small protein (DUF1192 family)